MTPPRTARTLSRVRAVVVREVCAPATMVAVLASALVDVAVARARPWLDEIGAVARSRQRRP